MQSACPVADCFTQPDLPHRMPGCQDVLFVVPTDSLRPAEHKLARVATTVTGTGSLTPLYIQEVPKLKLSARPFAYWQQSTDIVILDSARNIFVAPEAPRCGYGMGGPRSAAVRASLRCRRAPAMLGRPITLIARQQCYGLVPIQLNCGTAGRM